MGAQSIDLNLFNVARESYIKNDFINSLSILESIQGFDYRNIRQEFVCNNGNSELLKNLIETRGNELVGIFDCPYHPYLMLEYSKIEDISPTIEIGAKFKNIRCVRQIESTLGLSNEQVVAVFPENFRSIIASEEHPVFYFVDKFARRHLKYTRPLINNLKYKTFFLPLSSLALPKIYQLVANWVNIHEVSHRTGEMPIPQFLFEKSNRFTAALEELRADLITISKCFKAAKHEDSDEYLTGLYALAERLLAYPLFREKNNFDAISSIMMWKFMSNNKTFSEDLEIHKIKESIDDLIAFISMLEMDALKEREPELRKLKLKNLILNFIGNYDQEFKKYIHFWGIK